MKYVVGNPGNPKTKLLIALKGNPDRFLTVMIIGYARSDHEGQNFYEINIYDDNITSIIPLTEENSLEVLKNEAVSYGSDLVLSEGEDVREIIRAYLKRFDTKRREEGSLGQRDNIIDMTDTIDTIGNISPIEQESETEAPVPSVRRGLAAHYSKRRDNAPRDLGCIFHNLRLVKEAGNQDHEEMVLKQLFKYAEQNPRKAELIQSVMDEYRIGDDMICDALCRMMVASEKENFSGAAIYREIKDQRLKTLGSDNNALKTPQA